MLRKTFSYYTTSKFSLLACFSSVKVADLQPHSVFVFSKPASCDGHLEISWL